MASLSSLKVKSFSDMKALKQRPNSEDALVNAIQYVRWVAMEDNKCNESNIKGFPKL